MTYRPAQIYLNGYRTCIAGPVGRKYTPIVFLDAAGLTIHNLTNAEAERQLLPLDYPLARMVKRYREFGRQYGSTKAAARFLAQARHV